MGRSGLVLYLKRLEMTGFKSFPDHIALEFLRGVTAIVGLTEVERAIYLTLSGGCSVSTTPGSFGEQDGRRYFRRVRQERSRGC